MRRAENPTQKMSIPRGMSLPAKRQACHRASLASAGAGARAVWRAGRHPMRGFGRGVRAWRGPPLYTRCAVHRARFPLRGALASWVISLVLVRISGSATGWFLPGTDRGQPKRVGRAHDRARLGGAEGLTLAWGLRRIAVAWASLPLSLLFPGSGRVRGRMVAHLHRVSGCVMLSWRDRHARTSRPPSREHEHPNGCRWAGPVPVRVA